MPANNGRVKKWRKTIKNSIALKSIFGFSFNKKKQLNVSKCFYAIVSNNVQAIYDIALCKHSHLQ